MNVLIQRYINTIKGKQIIACLMDSPVKFCKNKFVDGEMFTSVNGKWLSDKELKDYKNDYQREIRKNTMIKYNLTEEDLILSEEKISLIEEQDNKII